MQWKRGDIMWSKKGIQKGYRLLIVLYVIMILVAVIIVSLIPTYFYQVEHSNFLKAETSIINILKLPSEQRERQFDQLVDDNALEIFIKDSNGENVYQTLHFKQIYDAKNALNTRAVAFEKAMQVSTNEGVFDVWFAVYHISPGQYLGIWTSVFLIIITSLFVLTAITISYTFKVLLKPVERLKHNLSKIQHYDFNLREDSKEDMLNKELNQFIVEIQGHIEQAQDDYSSLEIELQKKNEELINRSQLVASLTHDLKVPISLGMLHIEHIIHKEEVSKEALVSTYQRLEEAIQEVNDIVRVMYKESSFFIEDETFDLVQLVDQTTSTFHPFIIEKGMALDIHTDEHVFINTNRLLLKQLLYNALSNVVRYGKDHGELNIEINNMKEGVEIIIYNESKPLTQEQLNNAFRLFYRGEVTEKIGTGTGLYTIRRIMESLGGVCLFENKDKGVQLTLLFNYNDHFVVGTAND